MSLVRKEALSSKPQSVEKKLLYYRNPMNPEVTSPVPMKDSMGMDYVPVYEEAGGPETGIYMSQEKQQLIGIKKGTVKKMQLTRQILTVGKVAYDPELYVAQQEYLQAIKTANATKESVLISTAEQSASLVSAAEKKLLLLGMAKAEIEELAKSGSPDEKLYLPLDSDAAWVYMTIYEYEIGAVKAGDAVEIEAVAYPGEVFTGKIEALLPVLEAQTRSLQARARVADPRHELKPRMFVNARLKVDLGDKLAVPEEAVLDTGTRKLVYVIKPGDMLEARQVNLGQKAQGYYEVVEGLKEGEAVVTSGNFLVDSESKLKGAK
jgi:Cu(I)/Ag(I) efflux system membrane fusion protein